MPSAIDCNFDITRIKVDKLLARISLDIRELRLDALDFDFKEAEHPRDKSGKFTSGGGSGGKTAAKPNAKNVSAYKAAILKTQSEKSLRAKVLKEKSGWDATSYIPLTPAQKRAQEKAWEDFAKDPAGLMAKYLAENDHNGSVELNSDKAKELFPEYHENRTSGAAAVHPPASELVSMLYDEELKKPAPPGKKNLVFFTAGGAGSGKSSSIESLPGEDAIKKHSQLVYDGTLRPAANAIAKIDKALAAGKQAHIAFIYRDPVDAFINGVIKRAKKEEAEHGSGRTVPLDEFAKQHTSIQDSMRAVAEKYKDTPGVSLSVIDNSRGKGNSKQVQLHELPDPPTQRELTHLLFRALNNLHSNGEIPDSLYEATKPAGTRQEWGL